MVGLLTSWVARARLQGHRGLAAGTGDMGTRRGQLTDVVAEKKVKLKVSIIKGKFTEENYTVKKGAGLI